MHGHVIWVGRRNAKLYYRGGVTHGREPFTYELAEAAWFVTEEVARAVAESLQRFRDYPAGDRGIDFATWPDRFARRRDGATAAPLDPPDCEDPDR
jgi:hypothetical protein